MATLGRRGSDETSPGTAPLIILLVIAATVIFYVMTVTPEEREALIGHIDVPGVPEAEIIPIDTSPGLVEGIPASELLRYSHSLVTFTVDNTQKPNTKPLATNLIIKRSLVTDTSAEMSFIISEKSNLASANLEFLVTDRAEKGELIATLNEKVIYSAAVEAGQKAVVALPVDSIIIGENQLKIYAAGPGARFWATNYYSLSSINLVTYTFSDADAVRTQTISMEPGELAHAKSAKLTGFARMVSETPAKLTIKFNDEEIYSAVPKTTAAIAVGISASKLQSTNTLKWAVERGGNYAVEFGRLTVLAASTSSKVKTYSFELTNTQYQYIAAGGLYDCNLELARGTSSADEARVIDVKINGVTNTYTFIEDKLQEDVCSLLRAGANSVQLSAEEDIVIDKLKLDIKQRV